MAPWRTVPTELSWRLKTTKAIMDAHGWDYRAAIEDLPPEALDYLLFAKRSERVEVRYRHERGENSYLATFEGVVTNLERRYRETESEYIRTELEKYMVERPCPTCAGRRLKPEALGVTIGERHIADVAAMSVSEALAWVARPAGRAERARADHRAAGHQGDRRAARLPRGRRASTT